MYRVAVGDRIFAELKDKHKAIDLARSCSVVYRDKKCRLVFKNWNDRKGTPVFMNGEQL